MTRLRGNKKIFTARPFQNDGHSLYMTEGTSVTYRKNKLLRRRSFLKTSGSDFDFGTSVPKTLRVASVTDPTVEVNYTIPSGLLPAPSNTKNFTFDIRKHQNDIENLSTNYKTVTVLVDENGDIVNDIKGTHTLLNTLIKAAGVAVIRFRYHVSDSGVAPALFRVVRVSGPAGSIDETVNYSAGQFVYEITLTGLDDSAPYEFKLTAENGATVVELEASISVQADATGPTILNSGSVENV